MNYFLLICAFLVTGVYLHAASQPNVIVVITDDQGYGDLACLGNPVVETPNLDQLHAESVRFTDFHVDPTCAPTRGALLTGKYAHRAGVWHTVCGGNHLRASELTMADVFKQAGYRTALFGKWHLGSNYPYRPMDRGFDEWLGNGDGGTGTTDDWFDNDRVNDWYWHNGERVQREGFAPDVFFDAAIDYIQQDAVKKQPFLIYLATYLPHDPHTLPDASWADKYKETVSSYEAFYFAGVERIDWNIGRLRDALKVQGLAENTILIFMTDNGTVVGWRLFNAGMRGHKAQVYDGGHRVPFFIHWPAGKLQVGRDVSDLTAHIDVLPTLIELCGLSGSTSIDFDGRSFSQQLFNPELELAERTLFVENQRTFVAQAWWQTAGMTNRWRLVDDKELYDMSTDPGQRTNVINDHPEVVASIRAAHKAYWTRVTPNDRERPRFILGHHRDPELYLTPSDWYLEKETPWNHAQIAAGDPAAGAWDLTVATAGVYRFEVSRWPLEADAPIQGVPTLSKEIDAWADGGPVDKLIYGGDFKALPVAAIRFQAGDFVHMQPVRAEDKSLIFEVELPVGDIEVNGQLLDDQGDVIAGAYYMTVRAEDIIR
ncbi:arylsulfatase [Coraliomargarita akajimensis]|uniref:Sulfatase n=1 Tax=Coraliomargarita akajimensis (strain DSM 45221 / IAM 15411 / JCM 23193 / KCTC 12865 / 04OKA010-24) TaxID=583355 RepID=D5ENW8_CORAD|nr:arylsulfatase [Coraliomargarita akajimensis]ADE53627.1 sulfatase [Coraliomargarita akajimensis DSM 45221]